MSQLGLFETEELKQCQVEPKTTVWLGHRSAQVSLRRKQREAAEKLKAVLAELEGRDILIGEYNDFWWFSGLRLKRLKVGWGVFGEEIPGVIVLWGNKDANVRIFLDRLVDVRTQCYGGKPHYLIDFWNGFWSNPISQYKKCGYQSLHIEAVS